MTKVFVHGNPETSAIWQPLVQALHNRGVDDVVLLSPPGFGAPIPVGWLASREQYRLWLVGELEKIDDEVDLVGHDWGAGHVLSVLATRPDLVNSWATDCIGLVHPDYVWHDAAQAWQTPELGEQVVDAMVSMSTEDFVQSFTPLGMTDEIARAVKTAVTTEMGQCIVHLYRDAAQPAMAQLGTQLVATSLPRGLVVIADQDHYAGTVPMMEEMARLLNANTANLEGCGHWWMIEQPENAADFLIGHWNNK